MLSVTYHFSRGGNLVQCKKFVVVVVMGNIQSWIIDRESCLYLSKTCGIPSGRFKYTFMICDLEFFLFI
jgi:hypothetical protein